MQLICRDGPANESIVIAMLARPTSVKSTLSPSRDNVVNFTHDPLSPLNRSGDHGFSPRTWFVVEQVLSGFQVTATKIPATIASTRFRPSSIGRGYTLACCLPTRGLLSFPVPCVTLFHLEVTQL
jgi:hypothetical protein